VGRVAEIAKFLTKNGRNFRVFRQVAEMIIIWLPGLSEWFHERRVNILDKKAWKDNRITRNHQFQ
jgi:hypothetical protein